MRCGAFGSATVAPCRCRREFRVNWPVWKSAGGNDGRRSIMVPARAAAAIVDELIEAVVAALQDRHVVDALALQGASASWSSARKFGEFVRREVARYGKVIRDAGIRENGENGDRPRFPRG